MSVAPVPAEIFDRAVDEGRRRLEQSTLELVATSFIAGFTIVFGMVALGVLEGVLAPYGDGVAHVAGALGFGLGVVFLVVGRAELFNENFFDPVATAVAADGGWLVSPLVRLWTITLVVNFVGGGVFALVFAVDGLLPPGSAAALRTAAIEIVHRPLFAKFASAIVGGALVSLLSFMLQGVNSVGSRLFLAYVVGVLLALGPFDHVVVTSLHVYFGLLFGAEVSMAALAVVTVVAVLGNVVGGLGLVTITHVAPVVGAA